MPHVKLFAHFFAHFYLTYTSRFGAGDGVSHLAHLFGALVGACFGFLLHHPEAKKSIWGKITSPRTLFGAKKTE